MIPTISSEMPFVEPAACKEPEEGLSKTQKKVNGAQILFLKAIQGNLNPETGKYEFSAQEIKELNEGLDYKMKVKSFDFLKHACAAFVGTSVFFVIVACLPSN